MGLDINTAGCEFIRSILSLYRTAKYFREKEILAKKLIDHALEAGRLITELGVCPEYKESQTALEAREQLGKTLFILKVMHSEGIYPARRVQPVNILGEKLRELVELYIDDTQPSVPSAPVQPVQTVQPTVSAAEDVHKLSGNTEQFALPEKGKDSDGGFDEIYYGNIL